MSASKSSRRFISSSGTGFDTSSYSLQYPQSRLQRRIGMMCTRKGCFVDTSAFPIFNTSRVRERTNLARRRHFTDAEASTLGLEPVVGLEAVIGLDPVFPIKFPQFPRTSIIHDAPQLSFDVLNPWNATNPMASITNRLGGTPSPLATSIKPFPSEHRP
jgi:hypothetical protein